MCDEETSLIYLLEHPMQEVFGLVHPFKIAAVDDKDKSLRPRVCQVASSPQSGDDLQDRERDN